jgi:hypothetical protein
VISHHRSPENQFIFPNLPSGEDVVNEEPTIPSKSGEELDEVKINIL